MPDQLQLRGGTTAQHTSFTGASKEVTVDTTKKTAVVHDGSTVGGVPLLREDGSNSALALGSEGTPSLKWDANTGIFSPGEDQLAFVTNANRAITITSTQAVGIKTANPSTALHVAGSTRVGANSAADAFLEIGKGATGDRNSYIDIVADTTYTDYGLRVIRNNTGFNATSEIKHRGTGAFNIVTQEAAPIQFYTSNSPRVAIDSSGRLLVGTSTSLENVAGNLQVNGGSAVINTFIANSAAYRLSFVKSRSATFNEKAIVQSGDDLGRISFNGDDGVDYSSEAASIACQVDGTPGSDDMPGRLVFSTTADGAPSPTERWRITSGGAFYSNSSSIYIGTGGAQMSGGGRIIIRGDFYNGTAGQELTTTDDSNGAIYMQFGNSAGTRIGSITRASSTSIAFNSTSDYRLKENIAKVDQASQKIQQLRPVTFNFIGHVNELSTGFIAHELQEIIPEAVSGAKDAVYADGTPNYQGVDQSKLVPLLTAALQEAIAKIEALEAKVAALEAA